MRAQWPGSRRLAPFAAATSLALVALAARSARGVPPEVQPGIVAGVVRLAGDAAPEPTRVANTTDPMVCGERQTLQDLVVGDRGRGIANVIVAVTGVPAGRLPRPGPDTLVLGNRDCRFVPHAAAVTVGSTITAANEDPLLHTTHFYGALRANISLPVEGMAVSRTVQQAGMIAVKCDVHGWMQAFIRVDEHDLHAVTDTTGSYQIGGIPPGTYRIEFWHERLGHQSHDVRVEPGGTASLDVSYTLENRRDQ